ncbi:hypothetical protein GCM10009760_63200 [Kitasatospora kazusensis]|uniref:Terpene synthase n=1 Tax=Kitasatospora kazusensis TaxID=407974 RepID=A0ABN1ZLZ9_9ACTN
MTDLYSSARAFLADYGLHPAPDAYLAHGYVDLFLAAWRGASSPRLDLAARWALWTWRTDDLIDTELRDAAPGAADQLVMQLLDVLYGKAAEHTDHPTVRALADLVGHTAPVMPRDWWTRYQAELDAWLNAAADKLSTYVRPGRTPSLREYLLLRPVDGGMLLAAMWCELALDCVTPDWSSLLVHKLLDAFSAVGTLTNDLSSKDVGDTFTAQAALSHSVGLPPQEARQEVHEQLNAERTRFWFMTTAVRDEARLTDSDALHPVTATFAGALDRFLRALADWTRTSSRYTESQVAAVGAGVTLAPTARSRPAAEVAPCR